jgi:hypothetical protein
MYTCMYIGAGVVQSLKLQSYDQDDKGSILGKGRDSLPPDGFPVKCVPMPLYLGVKRSVRETDHSTPYSGQVKNVCSYTSTATYV